VPSRSKAREVPTTVSEQLLKRVHEQQTGNTAFIHALRYPNPRRAFFDITISFPSSSQRSSRVYIPPQHKNGADTLNSCFQLCTQHKQGVWSRREGVFITSPQQASRPEVLALHALNAFLSDDSSFSLLLLRAHTQAQFGLSARDNFQLSGMSFQKRGKQDLRR